MERFQTQRSRGAMNLMQHKGSCNCSLLARYNDGRKGGKLGKLKRTLANISICLHLAGMGSNCKLSLLQSMEYADQQLSGNGNETSSV